MTTPTLNYRAAGEPEPRPDFLPYVDGRFVRWHAISIGVGIGCLVLPQALGAFGFLLLGLLPGVIALHTLALGFPLMFEGFKSSGPLVFRIAVGFLGLVGPAISACAFFVGWGWIDYCC